MLGANSGGRQRAAVASLLLPGFHRVCFTLGSHVPAGVVLGAKALLLAATCACTGSGSGSGSGASSAAGFCRCLCSQLFGHCFGVPAERVRVKRHSKSMCKRVLSAHAGGSHRAFTSHDASAGPVRPLTFCCSEGRWTVRGAKRSTHSNKPTFSLTKHFLKTNDTNTKPAQ